MRICGEDIGYGDRVRVTVSHTSAVTGTDSITGPVVDFDVDDDGNDTLDIGYGEFYLSVLVRDIVGIERVE